MILRTVKHRHAAYRDDIGDLVTRRPLPGPRVEQIDPFLFLNHHGPQLYRPHNRGLPFGPHPHRGFETVTFILDGDLVHRDSGGHESRITAGGVQWMTAGRGIVHAELSSSVFKAQGGPLEILQLWVNLPARLKMTEPRYVGLLSDQIPAIATDEGRVTVNLVAGSWDGHAAALRPLTDIELMTIRFQPGGRVRIPVAADRNVFLYVARGRIALGAQEAQAFELVEVNDDGDALEMHSAEGACIVFGHARPYREPVVSHGPFVMNTREEILQAIRDYEAGAFGSLS